GAVFIVTTPCRPAPPITCSKSKLTVGGLSARPFNCRTLTVSVDVTLTPPKDAESVTGPKTIPSVGVDTVKVALVAPAGTVTVGLSGRAAFGLLLLKKTTAGEVGAGLIVTVPCTAVPGVTLVRLSDRL